MKKFLAFFTLAAILGASIAGAPSVIPHVHGSDFDHSQHKSCPVYLAGALHSQGVVTSLFVLTVFFNVLFLLKDAPRRFRFFPPVFSTHLRAPPSAVL